MYSGSTLTAFAFPFFLDEPEPDGAMAEEEVFMMTFGTGLAAASFSRTAEPTAFVEGKTV
jgi:hypothetical protein